MRHCTAVSATNLSTVNCKKFILHMRGLQEQVRDARHVLRAVIKKIYSNDVDHPMLLETARPLPPDHFFRVASRATSAGSAGR